MGKGRIVMTVTVEQYGIARDALADVAASRPSASRLLGAMMGGRARWAEIVSFWQECVRCAPAGARLVRADLNADRTATLHLEED